jgi:hypothetical protein
VTLTTRIAKPLHLSLICLLAGNLAAQDAQSSANTGNPAISQAFVNRTLFRSPPISGTALAIFPELEFSQQQPAAPPPVQPQRRPGWAARHVLLLTGLVLTATGAGLVAGGGNGQASGCLAAGPYGQVECTTVQTWGASGRHIVGLALLGAGVPLAIIGIFKHK